MSDIEHLVMRVLRLIGGAMLAAGIGAGLTWILPADPVPIWPAALTNAGLYLLAFAAAKKARR